LRAKVVALIPARYDSVRFPGKVLCELEGKPLIQWVWERASQARTPQEVAVATDDERVQEAVERFGGKVIMTSKDHQSGTDRLAEAVAFTTADVIVNVQGDEPLIHPESIDLAVQAILDDESVPMTSLKKEIADYREYVNPHVVKVVCNNQEEALYFSRSPIPHYRDREELLKKWEDTGRRPESLLPPPYKHLGLYVYETDFLSALTRIPLSDLEKAEKLEQLRALAWGFRIKVVTTPHDSIGVDTPEDLDRVKAILKSNPALAKLSS
jgi:3-deoxy-manno-octulosonate cytidylyltransferase (CMP-KDO synthetase)